MATYQQGVIVDGITTTLGLVQRITKRNAVQIVEAKDENGAVAAYTQINPTRDVGFEFIYDTSVTLPSLAAARTTPVVFVYDPDGISGSGSTEKYAVVDIEDVEENEGYRKANLNCRRYLENSIPAA
jgi:hypothetical protein